MPETEPQDDEAIAGDEIETITDEEIAEQGNEVDLPETELQDEEVTSDNEAETPIDKETAEQGNEIDLPTKNNVNQRSDDFEISFDEKDSLFHDKSENDTETENNEHEEKDYFECINQLSMELSTLPQEKGAMQLFHSMTSLSFGFSKSSLFLFSPSLQQFQCCEFENIDDESIDKLHFSVDFENIYQEISENGFFFITKDSDTKGLLRHFLSEKDFNDADFLLLIPYIFTSRMIGLFAGFKLQDNEKISPACIEALALVCRLNAALLYNLYQTENLAAEMEENSEQEDNAAQTDEFSEISEESDLPEVEPEENSLIENTNDIEEKTESLPDNSEKKQPFDEMYHKILFYLQKTIESYPDAPLSILKVQLTNTESLEKQIEGFKIDIFISDIQFIVMNIVGANGLVSMFNDFSVYAILPEADSQIADTLLDKITADIRNMFSEIFGSCNVEFSNSSVNYPVDSRNFEELFYMAKNGK